MNDTLKIGAIILNHFMILDRLGEGFSSTVYKIKSIDEYKYCKANQILVAKVYKRQILLQPNAEQRIQTEADLLMGIKHDNIIQVYELAYDNEIPILIMEFFDGIVLSQAPLGFFIDDLSDIIIGLLKAISTIHSAGIIHRDIKPDNILIGRYAHNPPVYNTDRQVKLLDFGVSRMNEGNSITESNTFLGTIRYGEPEYLFTSNAEKGSDLYSLSLVFLYLLTGKHPYSHINNWAELLVAKKDSPLPPEFTEPKIKRDILATAVYSTDYVDLIASITEHLLSAKRTDRLTSEECLSVIEFGSLHPFIDIFEKKYSILLQKELRSADINYRTTGNPKERQKLLQIYWDKGIEDFWFWYRLAKWEPNDKIRWELIRYSNRNSLNFFEEDPE